MSPTLRSYPVRRIDAATRLDTTNDAVVLDVRTGQEWARGHVRGAVHVPLPALAASLDAGEVPPEIRDRPVWVYCAAGFRAAIAASLPDAVDVPVTLLDGSIDEAAGAGLLVQPAVAQIELVSRGSVVTA